MHCTIKIIMQEKSGDNQPDEAQTEENINQSVKKVFYSHQKQPSRAAHTQAEV